MVRPIDVAAPNEGALARRALLAVVGQVLQGGMRFLTLWLIGRLGSTSTFAAIASAIALANLLSLAWPTTAGGAAARYLAHARGEGIAGHPGAVCQVLGARTLQATGLLALAALPTWWVIDGGLVEGLAVGLLVASFSGFVYTRGVHLGAGQASRQIGWDLVTNLLGVAGVVLVLLTAVPDFGVILVLAVSYGIFTVACWPWGARGTLPRARRREIDRFVAWGSLGTLASAGLIQIAMIVAGRTATEDGAAMFAATMALAAPAALVANAFAMVLFPSMAEALGRGEVSAMRSQLDRSTRLLTTAVVAVFTILVVGARPLVSAVWGERYAEAAVLVPLLLVPAMLRGIAAPSQGAVTTASRGGVVVGTTLSLAGLVVAGLLWWLLVPHLGEVGVGLGYALGTAVVAVGLFVQAWRDHEQQWTGLALQITVATTVMTVAAATLERLEPPLAVDVVVTGALVLLWLATRPSEVRALARRLRPAGRDGLAPQG